jgi:hypothetical protein
VRHDHYRDAFADDLALIFLSMADLVNGSKHVRDCFLQFGLKIHVGIRGGDIDGKDTDSKTLAMHFPKIQDRKHIPQVPQPKDYDLGDGTYIPFCSKFKYLGSILTPDLDDTTEIQRRLSLAQMVFNDFRKILCNQRIRVHLRRQLYQTCVLSVLLAGCETWAVKDSHLNLLEKFHRRCTRSMCGINLWHCQMHKITTVSILRRLNLLPFVTIFLTRQVRFLHRVVCMDPSRLMFQTLSSQALRLSDQKLPGGEKTNTCTTYRKTLEKTGLATTGNGGKLAEWIPWLRSEGIAVVIREALDLLPGSAVLKPRPMHPHTQLGLQ